MPERNKADVVRQWLPDPCDIDGCPAVHPEQEAHVALDSLEAENTKLREMVDYVITLFERLPDASDEELAEWIAGARASITEGADV